VTQALLDEAKEFHLQQKEAIQCNGQEPGCFTSTQYGQIPILPVQSKNTEQTFSALNSILAPATTKKVVICISDTAQHTVFRD